MVSCAPKGYFDQKPPLKQIWKWLKTILYEYMKLKKQAHGGSEDSAVEIVDQIKKMLDTRDETQLIPALGQQIVDNQLLMALSELVKQKLNIQERLTI